MKLNYVTKMFDQIIKIKQRCNKNSSNLQVQKYVFVTFRNVSYVPNFF